MTILTKKERQKEYERLRHIRRYSDPLERAAAIKRASKYQKEKPEVHRKASARYMEKNRKECYRRIDAWGKVRPEKKRFYAKMYRVSKSQATPVWADIDLISEVYQEAEYHGLHVDHIIPLRGKTVCGLNIWNNLQLITKSENSAKGNRRWPDMP